MTEMAMDPVTYSRAPMETIHRKILNIMKVPCHIPQALREMLDSAAEAFVAKSYKTSAKYFKNALDSISIIDEKGQDFETRLLTKYMLCMCWLESTDAKDLLDALKILEELVMNYGYAYPMLYYAVGTAYFKLYRFTKADEILKKGFAILNGNIEVIEYKIPGTDVVIHESSRDGLVAALANLNNQCSSWHRPDATCCMPSCSSHSQNESADKNIFFGSPTFSGIVQVSCNNTSSMCTMSFHAACWKAKKESLCSLGKLSDKDLLNWECFTPNCEDQGVRCTIKKIEIFDENAKVKATIESRVDEAARHAKVQSAPPPPPKGAIRKQQSHQPKVKSTTKESRPPPELNHRPPIVQQEVHKVDETEDDDDLHDEQALRSAIEQLIELRANNFGINDEKIWRPNLPMYGNKIMLATAEFQPDPDFSDEGLEQAELKAFFFSYFYTFISKSGSVKIDTLDEKWDEAKNMVDNCDDILRHYCDISEFLLQSVKFAIVGGYICIVEKLPEAYNLAKTDACETLRFFMENDIDQRSNSSSVDDDAIFNDIGNPEKNNSSLPYSSTSGDSRADDENAVSHEPPEANKKIDGPDSSKIGVPLQYAKKHWPEFNFDARVNGHTAKFLPPKAVTPHAIVGKKKSQNLIETNEPPTMFFTPNKKNSQKRPYPLENANNDVFDLLHIASNGNTKRDDSLPKTTNGVASPMNFASTPKISNVKFTEESKSANDIDMVKSQIKKNHTPLMSHSGEPNKRFDEMIPQSHVKVNGVKNSEKTSGGLNSMASKYDDNLVVDLLKEVERLSSKLFASEKRAEELKSEVAHIKKAHVAEKIKLSEKILQYQYAYNHCLVNGRLEECRKSYEIITKIQAILMTSIGTSLPISSADHKKSITDLNKLSKNLQLKFREKCDKVKTITEHDDAWGIINLQPDPMPSLPLVELSSVIQNAFSLYGFHRMPLAQNPIARNPMFDGQQFKPYLNNPGIAYPMSFNPNVSPPGNVCIPINPYANLPVQINNFVPQRPASIILTQNVTFSLQRQNSPLRSQQPKAFVFGQTSASLAGQSSVRAPIPSFRHHNSSAVFKQQSNIPKVMKIDLPVQNSEESSSVNRQTNFNLSVKSNDRVSTFGNNSQDPFDMRIVENFTSLDAHVNPETIEELENDEFSIAQPKELKVKEKKDYQSIDKLMKVMRSRYVGVLEFDMLKSIEAVRKNHNNSLSRMPMNQIIREAHRYIMDRQQKQLCGYEKRPAQVFPAVNPSAWCQPDGDRKPEASMCSTPSVSSAKKEAHGPFTSKKTWEPVVIPNDTWQRETPESECAICLETIVHTRDAYTLPCKHTFHKQCIKNWYTQNQSCPTCRVHSTIDDEYPPLPLG